MNYYHNRDIPYQNSSSLKDNRISNSFENQKKINTSMDNITTNTTNQILQVIEYNSRIINASSNEIKSGSDSEKEECNSKINSMSIDKILELNEEDYLGNQTEFNKGAKVENSSINFSLNKNMFGNNQDKMLTNITKLSTKAGMSSDLEEGELLDSSQKSLNNEEENHYNTSVNKNTSGSVSLSDKTDPLNNSKNIHNINAFHNENSNDKENNINNSSITENNLKLNCDSEKSTDSIEQINLTSVNNSIQNSRMLFANNACGANFSSNNQLSNFSNMSNRSNIINKYGNTNNPIQDNNLQNPKLNNSFNNLTFNKSNLNVQLNNNNNKSLQLKNFNNSNQTNNCNFSLNNPFKSNNDIPNMYMNNYAQYMQYMQNFQNINNNPNVINQLPNMKTSFPPKKLPLNNPVNINNFPNNYNPLLNSNTNPLSNGFAGNVNNLNSNQIPKINIPANIQNPNNNTYLISNNNNSYNFSQINSANNSNVTPISINQTESNNANKAEVQKEITEIREFKLLYNDNPLNIQLSGKIQKESKLKSFNVYRMATLENFLEVYISRLNFLRDNHLIVNLTFSIDKDSHHAFTRKFICELTEKNYFGIIKLERSFYIIFSSLNKIMYNNLGSNIFSVFILNDYQKIVQLEKAMDAFSTNKEIDKEKKPCNDINNLNEKNQIFTLSEFNRLKYEKEKIEKSMEELKKKLEFERNNNQETKNDFQKYSKRAKIEIENERTKNIEVINKLKNYENKLRELESKLKAANEKCKSLELEKIFIQKRNQSSDANNKSKISSNNNYAKETDINSNIKKGLILVNTGNKFCLKNNKERNPIFNYKPLSKLSGTENKIISLDESKIKVDYNYNLNDIEIELSDNDEGLDNPNKITIYDKIFENPIYLKNEEILYENNNNNISLSNISNINYNTSGSFNSITPNGNIIEEIGFKSNEDENEENLKIKLNELRERLDAHLCVICTENNRDCLFEDCGHLTCCYHCISLEMKKADIKIYQRVLKLNNKIHTFKFKFDFRCPVCQLRNKNFMKVILP